MPHTKKKSIQDPTLVTNKHHMSTDSTRKDTLAHFRRTQGLLLLSTRWVYLHANFSTPPGDKMYTSSPRILPSGPQSRASSLQLTHLQLAGTVYVAASPPISLQNPVQSSVSAEPPENLGFADSDAAQGLQNAETVPVGGS